ncbi:class I SAM-dependent methyltransferase [Dyella silvae]|uniref:class I SAM-dependent methyltransferase n=1 Tax=Dyella silvae TaxID=2994424 RepID=UPI002265536D|nr:class I SAM-dependent methyltransferase [Dyella silvae]
MHIKPTSHLSCMIPEGAGELFSRMADHFDRHPLSFWSLMGQRLVELTELKPGQQVLDIGSGTGAVSIPAAQAVHPGGSVLGIDIAQRMVDVAGRRAREAGAPRLSFHHADAHTFASHRRLDAILGGFSLYFIEDMRATLKRFQDWMKPTSSWSFSFWSRLPFAPLGDMLLEDLGTLFPHLSADVEAFRHRAADQSTLASLFSDFGGRVSVVSELHHFPVGTTDLWWNLVMHSDMRLLIEHIDPQQLAGFKRRHFHRIEEWFGKNTFLTVELPVQFAIVRFSRRVEPFFLL